MERSVIALKRSMNPGFAGIEKELFILPNTLPACFGSGQAGMMVFGDAKPALRSGARNATKQRRRSPKWPPLSKNSAEFIVDSAKIRRIVEPWLTESSISR
ncbi:MAG: hypothetical protein A2Z34_04625 [Planctomycetes bacterium RBG_16_59_8]|nr:MAG: hypothetical protein A2Z34_04625 [Planctomycetes bacterium RBG_16_59_8]